ncbi:phosphate ABC transporter permease PstA [Myroides odoratus]|uniref:Phosphate transport system permease protein PstA n=1 Tax=Myroides odoratus TaxID=256 RepID=A0A9Q6ZCB3_MYROD|nr:phosphate ABC transporter permease PstA [Myroides odoratus]EHQ43733.1 phosphate ABC transporter membrane protein 2, PhoT family [Myroides odoratus DSM 2801]EKB04272.1 phosphate ABC transporter, permease PstA [Myroides odoratus CIP 103059]QQU01050.1 phosphate ABC transporter permease PstA [Myroides odoratus]WQD56698.1 phosphate ABC transporter permease PstA [Myroides odoratus]STZ31010.1 Phosphate transport system permease protein pstA [Myroides odoratus]
MQLNKFKLSSIIEWGTLVGTTLIVCFFLVVILLEIVTKGAGSISWEFISSVPKEGMTKGGILTPIIGTVLITLITALFSIPFGVCCAIYLNEYAENNWLTRIIRAAIRNLSGVPSIIYGLFGLALFVQTLQLGTSLLAAGLTLGLLSLPYIITTTEEALMQIPNSTREAALAVGATKFETIKDVVIPSAVPGILTGVVLTLSRAAGETAPILFTGAAFYISDTNGYINQEFMALPYHLYMLSTQHQSIDEVRPIAYGTALILILVVFLLNLSAFYIRYKFRKNEN